MAGGLAEKLRLKEGYRAAVIEAPVGYLAELDLPKGVGLATQLAGVYDFVQVFVKKRDEVEYWGPLAVKAVKEDGVLWFVYPKKTAKVETDLTRDTGWEAVRRRGFEPVANVAVDGVWSALRFRPSTLVKHR